MQMHLGCVPLNNKIHDASLSLGCPAEGAGAAGKHRAAAAGLGPVVGDEVDLTIQQQVFAAGVAARWHIQNWIAAKPQTY